MMCEESSECRLCATFSNEFTSLLATFDTKFSTYQAAVLHCTGVLLYADDKLLYSPNICNECVKELHTSIQFRKKCETAHNLLQKSSQEPTKGEIIIPPKTIKKKLYRKHIKTARKNSKNEGNLGMKNRVGKKILEQQSGVKELIVDDFGEICLKYKSVRGKGEINCELKTLAVEFSNSNIDILDSVAMEQSGNAFDSRITGEPPDLGDSIESSMFQEDTSISKSDNKGITSIPKEKQMSCIKKVNNKLIIEKLPLAKIKHLAIKNFRKGEDGNFECQLCGETVRKSCRFRHYRKHLGPTHCNKCSKEYNTPQLLLSHIKKVHSGKLYVCHLCDKAYKRPTHLSTHMYSHTGEKPHKCPHCGRGFASRSNLLPHIKTHFGVRDFICSVCGIRKTTSSELRFHMRIHNSIKPFKCDYCSYAAVSDYAVRRHARRHMTIKPYACPYDGCELTYTTAYEAKRHSEVHTAKINYICKNCQKDCHGEDALQRHMASKHDVENPLEKKVKFFDQKIGERMEALKKIATMMKGPMDLGNKSVIEELYIKAGVKN